MFQIKKNIGYIKMLFRGFIFLMIIFIVKKSLGLTAKEIVHPGQTDLFELSVIHINDFHARFLETNPYSGSCNNSEREKCIGGFARVYTASRQLVDERPNAIFLNAGDNFQGTIWYNFFKWNVTAIFMNKLPHDAMTIGNHEFDDEINGLVPFLKEIKCPVVVTNIDSSREPTLQGLYKNSTIIKRGDKKIGIIGVILSTTNLIAKTGKLLILDEVESINNEADRLKAQGVNIIIVLSHCGLIVDRKIAEKCPNIDIIVGGHSHTFLYTGNKPYRDVPEDVYPVHVKQNTGRTVLIVQAAAFTRYIGNLTVWFDARGEILDWEGNPILLDNSITEDPEILAALQPWKEEADKQGSIEIGETKVYLQGLQTCRRGECNLGNLITDAMIDYYVKENVNNTYWTNAAIAVINAGAIRSDISNNPGTIKYEDLIIVTPFSNTYDLVELQGNTILKILEKAVITEPTEKFIGFSFLQWSGLKVTYNLSYPEYSRVIDVQIRCQFCQIPKYKNLDSEKWYKVAITDFLLNGGDNHTDIQNGYRNHQIGPLDIDTIVKFVKKRSPITYGNEERVILLQ
ncbi:apyrase-like isoform X2 [Leptopilina boulardi]|uniref:apyrase-like isoform X2 n=1 Tax=Leptopilina boulardi TaxID=63433 RepID=UPI0021F5A96E|nr:apyrase-like isoform X2 [Leptopilina boulardi]